MTELLEQLLALRALLARPDNDFSWSGWDDTERALSEFDLVVDRVRRGEIPHAAIRLFLLPTGPVQEVSISSGWGDEFVAIANRIDDLL